ncbi:hypothetical protein CIPAW_13G112200 [Carya illinoinensis]|uniref:Uncharacterized protein n=1 Tax=Carya illinoinensis TaxID=32201 RepID=A0A8T1NS67_CARIL|nr:hypothetical protein CIPAW_13G112200 [Carya illinoinensis]
MFGGNKFPVKYKGNLVLRSDPDSTLSSNSVWIAGNQPRIYSVKAI